MNIGIGCNCNVPVVENVLKWLNGYPRDEGIMGGDSSKTEPLLPLVERRANAIAPGTRLMSFESSDSHPLFSQK